MNFSQVYLGRSGVRGSGANLALSFAPNLRRDRVSFVGNLRYPLRFREAISALHGIVVSDLKSKRKDRSAYQYYLKRLQAREASIRTLAYQSSRKELLAQQPEPISPDLEKQFDQLRA